MILRPTGQYIAEPAGYGDAPGKTVTRSPWHATRKLVRRGPVPRSRRCVRRDEAEDRPHRLVRPAGRRVIDVGTASLDRRAGRTGAVRWGHSPGRQCDCCPCGRCARGGAGRGRSGRYRRLRARQLGRTRRRPESRGGSGRGRQWGRRRGHPCRIDGRLWRDGTQVRRRRPLGRRHRNTRWRARHRRGRRRRARAGGPQKQQRGTQNSSQSILQSGCTLVATSCRMGTCARVDARAFYTAAAHGPDPSPTRNVRRTAPLGRGGRHVRTGF